MQTESTQRQRIAYILISDYKASNDMSGELYINGKRIGTVTNVQMPEFNREDASTPINPNTGKPYFKINENAWDGEWVAGEVQHIPSSEFGGDDER